ncbi:MAG: hypothetical protein IH884_08625 [Myxococcales bacterium]|nr:hypothetical protein [Myxococcales bacterium]
MMGPKLQACLRAGRERAALALVLALVLAAAAPRSEASESLGLLDSRPTKSELPIGEAQWARELTDVFGIDHVLKDDAVPADHFGLLCADEAELEVSRGGAVLPRDEAFRVSVEAPERKEPLDPLRVVLNAPATALYRLTIEGAGVQRWTIDSEPVGHLDLSDLGIAQVAAIVPLDAGPHEISGYLLPGARVDRIELAAWRPLCISPADGWHARRTLQYGAMARTLVRAFDLEQRLPERKDEELRIEGEAFEDVSGGGQAVVRLLKSRASGERWASAVQSPASFSWFFELEAPRVVTLMARTHGVQPQLWSINGRYRITVIPEGLPLDFSWTRVATLTLSSGRHAVRGLFAVGAGVDELRIISHRSSDPDYVGVISQIGFFTSVSNAPVGRSEALDLMRSAAFIELASALRSHLHGNPADRSLVLVDDEPDSFVTRPLSPFLPADL